MRTWDENRMAINQLWPQCQWTDEERRLWSEDLGHQRVDQDLLYGAMKNVKRSRDTLYPQLKWILDEYRELGLSQKKAMRQTTKPEPKLQLNINDDEDKRLAQDFVALIDVSSAADFDDIEQRVLDKLPQMHSRSAVRLLNYARHRLLGETPQFGRVTQSGDIQPIAIGA